MLDFNINDNEDINPFFEGEKKRVLVLGNVNEIIANATVVQLRERGFEVITAPPTIGGVCSTDENIRIYLVVMDRGAVHIKDLLVYLKDIVTDKRKYVCVLGSKTELPQIYNYIPPEDVTAVFERPIGVQELCEKMEQVYEKSRTDSGKKSILLVDDDPTFLKRTQKILKDQYKVYVANSGANAILLLGKHRVDLVLLDYEMPVVEGPQVFEMIKGVPELADTPIMFLTGRSDIFSVSNALQLGPKSYIVKTTPVDEFKKMIAKYFLEEKAAGKALK